jgi:hypothetical protein
MSDWDIEIDDATLEAFLHDPNGPSGLAVEIAAFATENKAKANLLEPGTGRVYTTTYYYTHFNAMGEGISIEEARAMRDSLGMSYTEMLAAEGIDYGGMMLHKGRKRPAHQASAPGEPAASDHGMLLNTTSHKLLVGDDGPYALVGSPLAHALFTELGTNEVPARPGEHHGMLPRPWLRPALDVVPEVLPL